MKRIVSLVSIVAILLSFMCLSGCGKKHRAYVHADI